MSAAVDTPAVTALNEALRLAEHGYALTPVTITRSANGKKAARFHKGWRHESAWSRDPDQVRQWWVDHPDTSFAIGCAANGIEGTDLDVKPALGIDAVAEWAARGLPLSSLVQHTPSGGLHSIWRVRADGLALPQEAGKTLGVGLDTRNRAGLFFAAGAYILGEEGHYTIAGTLPRLDQLEETPLAVLELFAEGADRERAERPTDGRIVIHDEQWQRMQVERAAQAVRDHPRDAGGYRAKLQHLGLFYGRVVEQGFLDRELAELRIIDAHRSVWGPQLWPENLKDIRDALKDGPRLERWRVPVTPSSTNGSRLQRADGFFGGGDDQPSPAAEPVTEVEPSRPAEIQGMSDEEAAQYLQYQRDKSAEKRRLRLRREAAAELAAEEREPLRVLSASEFLKAPMPDYLVPKMLYRDGLSVVFGPPGAAKSFLVLDIALSLATGTPWRGRSLGQGRVHYVMAEGQTTNTLRTLAWLHHHEVAPERLDGWLDVVPQAVVLTEAGVVDYLERVRADQPDLIVLDTKNLMFAGKESQGDDYGAMLRVLHAIRQAAGGAAVVLIDHSGLGDDSRVRGSNAQKGGVETEIRVVEDEQGLRQVEVTRDKSGAVGARWTFRLHQIPEVPRPIDVDPPAVCVPVEADELQRVAPSLRDSCWDMPRSELPEAVALLPNAAGEAAGDLFRMLLYVQDADGLTASQMNTMLGDAPRKHSRAAVYRAVSLLAELRPGVVVPGTVSKSWVLAPDYVGWQGRSAYVSELS